jgi:hypothetical protein
MAHLVPVSLPIRLQCLRVPVSWSYKGVDVPLLGPGYQEGPDAYTFQAYIAKGEPSTYDPWEMRDEFFRLQSGGGPDKLLQFLNKTGLFDKAAPEDIAFSPKITDEYGVEHKHLTFWVRDQPRRDYAYFWDMRALLCQSMLSQKDDLLRNFDFSVRFVRAKSVSYFLLTTVSLLEAVAASIQIDHLLKAKFQKCARPDCAIVFSIKNDRHRKFCSWYCGHIESVRKLRRKSKEGKERKAMQITSGSHRRD